MNTNLLYLLLPAFLWGSTEPLMKRFSQGHPSSSLGSLLRHSRGYALSYIANQLGAVLFFVFLKFNDLNVGVPFANSAKFIFNYGVGRCLGEASLTPKKALGLGLILCGCFVQVFI
eukprot:TRINITY_DN5774_c0_g1_i1.p1 TRINITY_DN5774_c0_g1~~TRINITY_DN5774_c0_g1_i1.p1  ORF type:complete len:116 (-),score=31.11 TRINITY_DN5774_c0_g1_i1:28-375(-)